MLCLRYSVCTVCNQLADAFDRCFAAFQDFRRTTDGQTLSAAADDVVNPFLTDPATELFAFGFGPADACRLTAAAHLVIIAG